MRIKAVRDDLVGCFVTFQPPTWEHEASPTYAVLCQITSERLVAAHTKQLYFSRVTHMDENSVIHEKHDTPGEAERWSVDVGLDSFIPVLYEEVNRYRLCEDEEED